MISWRGVVCVAEQGWDPCKGMWIYCGIAFIKSAPCWMSERQWATNVGYWDDATTKWRTEEGQLIAPCRVITAWHHPPTGSQQPNSVLVQNFSGYQMDFMV